MNTTTEHFNPWAVTFSGTRMGSVSELELPSVRPRFDELATFSDRYVREVGGSRNWPVDYPWPHDALRCNTRLWEYPFAWDAVHRQVPKGGVVLDIGSALTFFPAFLAYRGYRAIASDIDSRVPRWFDQIRDEVGAAFPGDWPELLSVTSQDVTSLDMPDSSVDAVTNISVLEHLPNHVLERAVESIGRVLKPGGLLVCTLDLWIRGPRSEHHHPLNQDELSAFMGALLKSFEMVEPVAYRAPSDLITNQCYPAHLAAPPRSARSVRLRPRRMMRALFNQPEPEPLEWGVLGVCVRAKGRS